MSATGTAREESQSMEFSVTKTALLNELTTTQGVVERKTTIPILSNLLLEAREGRVVITATDLELSVRTSCEAKVRKEGAGTIPAKKLLELVRLLRRARFDSSCSTTIGSKLSATKRNTNSSAWQKRIFRRSPPCRICW